MWTSSYQRVAFVPGSLIWLETEVQLDVNMRLFVFCFSDSRSPDRTQSPALVAMVNVFVLVTSVTPLTAFMHDISVVWANQSAPGQQMKVKHLQMDLFLEESVTT